MSSRSWTVRIPAPAPFINANHRKRHRALAGTVRLWRDAGAIHARKAKLPQLAKAHITATLHFADRRQRDDHNYFGTVKALVDGMVKDYGLLPDDSTRFLVGTEIRGGDPIPSKPYGPAGEVVLLIREVT